MTKKESRKKGKKNDKNDKNDKKVAKSKKDTKKFEEPNTGTKKEVEEVHVQEMITYLPIEDIHVEKDANPRQVFDEENLRTLAQTQNNVGILNPLIVYKRDGKYYLVSGERRLRASKLAGLAKVPVRIKEYSEGQAVYVRFVENAHQQPLNPLERAKSIAAMIGQTIEEPVKKKDGTIVYEKQIINAKKAAEIAHLSQSSISQYLALLELPAQIKEAIHTGEIKFAHARGICEAKSREEQLAIFESMRKNNLNRAIDVKGAVEKLQAKKRLQTPPPPPPPPPVEETVHTSEIVEAPVETSFSDSDADMQFESAPVSESKESGQPSQKRRGRPLNVKENAPDLRQGVEIAIDTLRCAEIAVRDEPELKEGLAQAYGRFERARTDDRKTFLRGVIAGLEWVVSFRDGF